MSINRDYWMEPRHGHLLRYRITCGYLGTVTAALRAVTGTAGPAGPEI